LHSWSEHKQQQKEVKEFLIDLKADLNADMESMTQEKNEISKSIEQFTFLKNVDSKEIDSFEANKSAIHLHLNPTLRTTSNGNYEGFKSSGKIGFIENKKLKKQILEYYQEVIPLIEKLEAYYNSKLDKLGELASQKIGKRELYLDQTVKRTFDMIIQSANNNVEGYDQGITKTKEIITEIDKEEKE